MSQHRWSSDEPAPAPAPAPKVEKKVKWATAGSFLGFSVLMYALELVRDQPVLVTPLPDVLEPLVLALVPTLVTMAAGWRAPHTPRPDLPPAQR